MERFEIRLVDSVSNDLNVHLIQILFTNAIDEIGSQRGVHQDSIVQVRWSGRHVNGLHLVERPQWMTFGNQLGQWALMQSA